MECGRRTEGLGGGALAAGARVGQGEGEGEEGAGGKWDEGDFSSDRGRKLGRGLREAIPFTADSEEGPFEAPVETPCTRMLAFAFAGSSGDEPPGDCRDEPVLPQLSRAPFPAPPSLLALAILDSNVELCESIDPETFDPET